MPSKNKMVMVMVMGKMLIQLVLVIVIWGPFSCNFDYLRWDTMQCGLQKYWGQNTYNGNKEFYFNITEDFVLERNGSSMSENTCDVIRVL